MRGIQEIKSIFSMLCSTDIEMQNLGLIIVLPEGKIPERAECRALVIGIELEKLLYNVHYHIEEIEKGELSRMVSGATDALSKHKLLCIRLQKFEMASQIRDVENHIHRWYVDKYM